MRGRFDRVQLKHSACRYVKIKDKRKIGIEKKNQKSVVRPRVYFAILQDKVSRFCIKDNLMNLPVALDTFNLDVSNQHDLIDHHILCFVS